MTALYGHKDATSVINMEPKLLAAGFSDDPPIYPSQADRDFSLQYDLRYESHTCTLNKDAHLLGKFLRIGLDNAARDFMAECLAQFGSWTSMTKHKLLRPFIGLLYSHTDINAILHTGNMHLLSTAQFRMLMQKELKQSKTGKLGRLMDVGSGCGDITKHLAPFFDEVVATEVAPRMIARLRAHGFTALQTSDLDKDLAPDDTFDMIALLNVIDRCDAPVSLLKCLRKRLRSSSSWLLLATPLPIRPSVETAAGWVKPSEDIIDRNNCACCTAKRCCVWEESVRQVVREYIIPNGFAVRSVSRIPYISQGDCSKSYYVLDDAVFVLYKTDAEIVN